LSDYQIIWNGSMKALPWQDDADPAWWAWGPEIYQRDLGSKDIPTQREVQCQKAPSKRSKCRACGRVRPKSQPWCSRCTQKRKAAQMGTV
jgi:hypothetical protein